MRLSKVAKELNVGIANIVEYLASKGIKVDGRPNTKITPDAYEILKQQFSADVEEHKRSTAVAQARREEKQAIKDEAAKKIDKTAEVVKAKAIVSGPKMVGKIEFPKTSKTKIKDKSVNTNNETFDVTDKPEKESNLERKDPYVNTKEKADLNLKNNQVVKEKSAKSPPKHLDDTDINKSIRSDLANEVKSDKEEKTLNQNEQEVLRAKSKAISGPKLTGQVIDLDQFKKPKKKVASSSNPSGNKDNKKKRKRINQGSSNVGSIPSNKSTGHRGVNKGRKPKVVKVEPTEEEIQKKIAETLDKLTGKGKSKGAKHRRIKRDERREQDAMDQMLADEASKTIKVTEFVTVNELASMMDVQVTQIISSCMMLGIMVTMNQRLDAETLTIVADEFGYEVEFVSAEVQESIIEDEDKPEDLVARSPIVTVMGHVDHGKTSLLDVIREKKVADSEAGGITQHIGSYIVEAKKGQMVTFIDTPGHAAFSQMRARGSNITDIIILVVAADDSVNEQTIEAISHAKASGCPIIVAVNKIDLSTANPQKVESDLMNHEIISEKMGGQNVFVNVSAKTKEGIEDLLDSILLQAEILELKANPDRSAEGTVIESKIEKGRGTVVSVLIQNGSLDVGDIAVIGKEWGKVRAMYDDSSKKIGKALPSYPVEILGLSGAPNSGDKLVVVENESRAREVTQYRSRMKRMEENSTIKRVTVDQMIESASQEEKKVISVIVKADVHGSKEAIEQSLNKMNSEKVSIKIIHSAVGEINESDVTLAIASNARIFGFNVKANTQAKNLSKKEGIKTSFFSIIYEVIDEAQKIIEGLDEEKIIETLIGKAMIKQVFQLSDASKVAGCVVQEGKVTSKAFVKILRDENILHECEIQSLRREKNQVKEVLSGLECGIVLSKFNDVIQNDRLEFYTREKDEKKP